ncbi:IMPACT family protein [Gilvimarinus polysaccharolyticus]|uniref:IMPACT family protein n=1 Tax=Gilvimarinus polysaccharolyticus TaxID=863921 RepID=UPI0006738C52|nr:YigZ family protein [Gilvimarinus polysaccharolyticus]
MSRPYQVLAEPCEFMLEEKRSTFTAVLSPAAERETALAQLDALRHERPGASHYCWAYILGAALQPKSMAFSDDGEPSGTAGKPILNVLEHRDAGDCMAVVVRTFGGTKLGAGGLVRAYGAAISGALDIARWRLVTPSVAITIAISFAHEERVRHCLALHNIQVNAAEYLADVTLAVDVPESAVTDLVAELGELTSGAARVNLPAA